MTWLRLVICVVALALAAVVPVCAAMKKSTPQNVAGARPTSSHFKTFPYTGEIIVVHAKVGRMLEIEFGKAETSIEFAMGDREAWNVKTVGNVMFIKPKAMLADTNLRVITNRRKYWFDLVMTDQLGIVPYHIDFKYPAELAAAPGLTPEQFAQQERRAIDTRLSSAMQAVITKAQPGRTGQGRQGSRALNGNYDFIGPDELLPMATYDNGEMTYIEFAPNNPMPVVFAVDQDGSESRVNFHVEKDIFIVHRTARRLLLRRGSTSACLINGSFRTTGASTTYTSSDSVQRRVQGEVSVP